MLEVILSPLAKMSRNQNRRFPLAVLAVHAFLFSLPFVASSQCKRKPVIFNFGDSNSDTGGFAAALGYSFDDPYGRAFFHRPTGRLSDGRLIIDFLCESLKAKYLSPYMESMEPDFSNGVNFAVSGSTTLPRSKLFSLNVQVHQFQRFQNRTIKSQTKGSKNLVRKEDFKNALYTIDIGQNDLTVAFTSGSYDEVIEQIPSFISEIKDAIRTIYLSGGKKFWVHNTGPLGCLPEKLGSRKTNASDFDEYGCIKPMNEASKAFNDKLRALCEDLRLEMKNATIVYVDVYSIKYDLVANSASYGFKRPLMACCGHGGAPYNYDPSIRCFVVPGYTVCEKGLRHISWDGIHYTETANAIVASKILSRNYSVPPLGFNFFCNKA